MRIRINLVFILLTPIFLFSCGQDHSQTTTSEDAVLPDSVLVANYFFWTEKQEYISPDRPKDVLADQEHNRDTSFLHTFIQVYYDSIKPYDTFPWKAHELVKYLYAIDINDDNLLDVLYSGSTGAEENMTQIFLNQGRKNRFKKVFSGYQNIIQMGFSNQILTSFTLDNPGCCADPEITEHTYSVTHTDSIPTFTLQRTIGYLNRTELAKHTYAHPREFNIVHDTATLRNETYILTITHPVWETQGNIVGLYRKGRKGLALGSKKEGDKTWLYVHMPSPPDRCEWPAFTKQPTELYGWLLQTDTDLP